MRTILQSQRHSDAHKSCESIAEEFEPKSKYSGLMRKVCCFPVFVWMLTGTLAVIGFICGISVLLLNGTRETAIQHEGNVIKAQTGELMGDTQHQIKHQGDIGVPPLSAEVLSTITAVSSTMTE